MLLVFFICLAIGSFVGAYYQVAQADVNRAETAGDDSGMFLWVPDSSLTSGSDSWKIVYPLLRKAAQNADVNVIRTSAGYTNDGRPVMTHFLLSTIYIY